MRPNNKDGVNGKHIFRLPYLLIIAITAFLYMSCIKDSGQNKLATVFKEKCIQIDSDYNSLYLNSISRVFDDETYLYCYNKSYHKIDIFNLTDQTIAGKTQLDYSGPNAVSDFNSFEVISQNHYLFCSHNRFIFAKDTVVLERINFLSENKNFTISNGYSFDDFLLNPGGIDGIPSDKNNNFYFGVFPRIKPRYFEIIKVNFRNRTIEKLDFQFPEVFKDNFFGDNMTPYLLVAKDKLFINYGFSSRIFTYDLNDGTVRSYNPKSTFTVNQATPISYENFKIPKIRVAYDLTEINFYGLKYDAFRDVFYRVHLAPRSENDGKLKFYFMIMDKDLNTLGEVLLPEKLKPYFEIGKEGVFFPKMAKSESQLCFELLSILQSK